MELARYLEALETDLDAIAAVGDEASVSAARRISQAIRSSAGLRLLEVLSEVAVELSAQLPSGHVEVRLSGQDPNLVYVEEEQPPTAPPPADDAGARITLRLPEALKGSIEAAAAREGISVNAWIVRALSHVVAAPAPARGPRVGSRLTGFAKS